MRASIVIATLVLLLSGCGGYTLQGRVVEGSAPALLFVDGDDPQLDEPGIPNARIVVTRDPDRLSRNQVADGYSRGDGRFEIPIAEFGAGWMDEQWLIQAWRSDYETVESITALAKSGSELLIVLRRGRSAPPLSPKNPDEIIERYK